MFPEIVRDEVFRIESRRLWLRWPVTADAFDDEMATTAIAGSRDESVGLGYRLPSAACVVAWRSEAQAGIALHLVLEEKTPERVGIGTVHLTQAGDGSLAIDYHLAPSRRGEGLMTEAIQAVIHAVFLLTLAPAVTAAPAAADPKGRDVLERCGFTYLGSGMRPSRAAGGLAACDHFRLDRRTWISLQGWAASGPGLRGRLGDAAKPHMGLAAQA